MAFLSEAQSALFHLLEGNPVVLLFLLMGLGYLIGNIRIRGFSLGPVAGALFAGIYFGHFGLRLSPAAQSLGFALFIFAVGYQAGPRFFSALRADGVKYFLLALTVAVSAVTVTLVAVGLIATSPGNAAGLLAGGLTSSPTLAAAQDAVREGSIAPPQGMSADDMISNIASAYAITYIFGLTGLITLIRYLPRLLGLDIAAECRKVEEAGMSDVPAMNLTTRRYRVENPAFLALTAGRIAREYLSSVPLATLERDGEEVGFAADDVFQAGDVLTLTAPREAFLSGISDIGPELALVEDLLVAHSGGVMVVTNKEIVGASLGSVVPTHPAQVLVRKVTRAGVQVPHTANLELERGDVLQVVGDKEDIRKLADTLGYLEGEETHTDMVTFAFGIVAGTLLGMLSIEVNSIALGLGTAGGLLASGLVIGYLRSVRPTFGRLPEATSWWLMEFGLLLFMAGVGLSAGGTFVDTLAKAGPALVVAGILVTSLPLLVAYFVGARLPRLNPALLMGALTGAMTSGASLSVVTREAGSAVPAIGYAGTYAFGNVLLMVAGPVVLLLG